MKVSEFFGWLLEVQVGSKLLHLKVKSYAKHVALGELYDGLGDKIDELIEVYQGQYGIVEDLCCTMSNKRLSDTKSLEYVMDAAKKLSVCRSCINAKDTHLQNIVDEIQGLLWRTTYKLRDLQ